VSQTNMQAGQSDRD